MIAANVGRKASRRCFSSSVALAADVPALWWLTRDGDAACLAMYERHYSAYQYRDGRKRVLFVGPGEKVVLRTWIGDAVFVWRKFIDDSGQNGINCAVFRNESGHLSSELVRQADAIADCLWPDCRHYTHVNAARIKSANPGFCFLKAGWRRCGMTKSGLITLERLGRAGSGGTT
jgi:hypothetical protein